MCIMYYIIIYMNRRKGFRHEKKALWTKGNFNETILHYTKARKKEKEIIMG